MASSPDISYCLPPDGKYDREGRVIIHVMSKRDRESGLPPQDGYFRIECTEEGHKIVCIPKLIVRLKAVTGTTKESKKKKKEDEILSFLAHEGQCLLTASYSNRLKEQLDEEYELMEVVDYLLDRKESEEIQECKNRMWSLGKRGNLEILQADIDRIRSEEEDKYLADMEIEPGKAGLIKEFLKDRNNARAWVIASRRELSIQGALLVEELKKCKELLLQAIQEKKSLVFQSSNWLVENDLGQYFFHGEYLWVPELQIQLKKSNEFENNIKILAALCRKSYMEFYSYSRLQNSVSVIHWIQTAQEINSNYCSDLKKSYLKRHLETLGFDWILIEHGNKGRPKLNNHAEQKPLTGRGANRRSIDPTSKRNKKR